MVCSSSDGRARVRARSAVMCGLAAGQAVASRGNGIPDRRRVGGSGNDQARNPARDKINAGGLDAVDSGDRTLNAGHTAAASQSFNAVLHARFSGRSGGKLGGAATAARRRSGQGQFGA